MTLLGASILEGKVVDKAVEAKIMDLERATECLSLLQAHDALCLLKNALAMPKLFVYSKDITMCRQPAFV